MSSPVLPDTTAAGSDLPAGALTNSPAPATEAVPGSSAVSPVDDGLLTKQAIVTEAIEQPVGPPMSWIQIGASEATSKLDWFRLYPRLETVPEGSVVMVPTIESNWVKIIKGAAPTSSAFFINSDTFAPQPGSLAASSNQPPAPVEDPLEQVHLALDVIGLAPVLGEPADAVNGVIYFIEGDTFNGTLSMAAVVPVWGDAATLTKWGVKYGDELVDFGSRNLLRQTMNLLKGVEAHHIVPWELRFHEIIQAAGRAGFDLNNELNGFVLTRYQVTRVPLEETLTSAGQAALDKVIYLELPTGVHANHPAYNFYVIKWLETFTEKLGGIENIDPYAARELLEKTIIPALDEDLAWCVSNDKNVNTFFKERLVELKWYDTYKDYASSPTFYSFIHGTNELLTEITFMKR